MGSFPDVKWICETLSDVSGSVDVESFLKMREKCFGKQAAVSDVSTDAGNDYRGCER